MSITKFAVAVATVSLIAGSAFAGTNVLGAWKGKLKIDLSKLPASTTPQQKQMIQQQSAIFGKMNFAINIVKNGSFTMKITGVPSQTGKPTPVISGTWTLKGNQLTMQSAKSGMPPEVFTISKDGKSFSAEQGPGGGAKIVFTR